MPRPKWLDDNSKNTTRARSIKQEKSLSKKFKGRTTINSGATFKQNDVMSERNDIEAKITSKRSFVLKEDELDKMTLRSSGGRIPTFVITFEGSGKSYVVVEINDYIDNLAT